jgi:hypothetical protein
MHVELIPPAEDGAVITARINGGDPIPVLDYAVSPGGEGGNVALNLVLPVDSLSIGDPKLSQQAPQLRPAVPEKPVVPTWGSPASDPRVTIPGWQPEKLGEQVAQSVRDAVNRAGGVRA